MRPRRPDLATRPTLSRLATAIQWVILGALVINTYKEQTNIGQEHISSLLSVNKAATDGTTSSSTSALDIPRGVAVALPSIRIQEQNEENEKIDRKFYGGKGDKVHLGGFTEYDYGGVSPRAWKYMIQNIGIKTVLDVGCGRGISTSWFLTHGVDAKCVEGSHDAIEQSMIPEVSQRVTEHDFSRGPWWPDGPTVDAIWAVEFLEHVGRNYHHNYLPAFRKSALIFATHSNWGGWHHVEVHNNEWWVNKFEMYGFKYSESLSNQVKKIAYDEMMNKEICAPGNQECFAQHIYTNLKVFINPVVSALPEHAHLLSEHGCYESREKPNIECNTGKNKGKESQLPESFYPIQLTEEMDKAWWKIMEDNIKVENIPK